MGSPDREGGTVGTVACAAVRHLSGLEAFRAMHVSSLACALWARPKDVLVDDDGIP